MPRNAKCKRTKSYTKEELEIALVKIKSGLLIKQASKLYNIPRPTLQNRIHNRTKQSVNCSGPAPILTVEEENDIVEWIILNCRRGFPRRFENVQCVVKEFLDASGRPNPFRNNKPGITWYNSFLKRHPIVVERTPETVTSASSKVSESDIRGWFQHLTKYFTDEGLLHVLKDPSRIYNADETNFLLCPKTGKVLAPIGERNVYEVDRGNDKEAITVLMTFLADGDILTPLIVYKYKRIPIEMRQSIPNGFAVEKSDTGWMNAEVFYDFLKNTFYPDLINRKATFPVIFFVDGHTSHHSLKISFLCNELGIVLICFYPNATRILQPADVSMFKPLKSGWGTAVSMWREINLDLNLTKIHFAPILKLVTEKFISKSTIVNGFRTCGLFPFNPDAIDYSKCLGKNSTKNVSAIENDKDVIVNSNETGIGKVMDLCRFKELVGAEKLSQLISFDDGAINSWDLSILHSIYKELSTPENDIQLSIQAVNAASNLTEDTQIENSTTIVQVISIENADSNCLVSETAATDFDEFIFEDFTEDTNNIRNRIVNMDDAVVIDAASLTIKDYLLVPQEPTRKGSTTTTKRSFVITSKEYQQDEIEKSDKKTAEVVAKEARKKQRAENKLKKTELYEELKKHKLERAALRKVTAASTKKKTAVTKKCKQKVNQNNQNLIIDVPQSMSEGEKRHSDESKQIVCEQEKQMNTLITKDMENHVVNEQEKQIGIGQEMNMVNDQEKQMVSGQNTLIMKEMENHVVIRQKKLSLKDRESMKLMNSENTAVIKKKKVAVSMKKTHLKEESDERKQLVSKQEIMRNMQKMNMVSDQHQQMVSGKDEAIVKGMKNQIVIKEKKHTLKDNGQGIRKERVKSVLSKTIETQISEAFIEQKTQSMPKNSLMKEQGLYDSCLNCFEQITNSIVSIPCLICNGVSHLNCAIRDSKMVCPSEFTCKQCINKIIF